MAREQKSIPIIYLVNNEGRGAHLYQVLKPVLEANEIPFLSTHTICPPDDPTVYTGINSHFIPSKDQELAREIIKIIERGKKSIVVIILPHIGSFRKNQACCYSLQLFPRTQYPNSLPRSDMTDRQ